MKKRRSEPKKFNHLYDRCVTRISCARSKRAERCPQTPRPLWVQAAAVGNAGSHGVVS